MKISISQEVKEDAYKRAIKHWGTDAQIGMLQEEAAEVIVAANKVRRGSQPHCLLEELADLEIMIEQVKIILRSNETIENIKQQKLKRLIARLPS